MTVAGLVSRFLTTYILLLIVVGQILHWVGIQPNEAMFIGMLIGSTIWPCMAFGKRNGRYLDKGERIQVTAIILLIDMFMQILFGNAPLPGMTSLPALDALAAFGLVLGLHLAVIAFFVNFAQRQLIKMGVLAEDKQDSVNA